jgi:hypothetical protein
VTADVAEFDGPEAPFTITLKGGSGYDKPWLVLRAASAEDAVALLVEAKASELLEQIASYATDFQEKVAGAAPEGAPAESRSTGTQSPSRSGSSGGSQRRGAAPAPKQSSDVEYHPEGLTCGKANCGGSVIFKKITTKAGKSFELWVCEYQREKGDGHHSEFIN